MTNYYPDITFLGRHGQGSGGLGVEIKYKENNFINYVSMFFYKCV